MNNCSICGFGVAWCVDKEDKGTYWLCGRCAVEDVTDMIKSERPLVRVARAAKKNIEFSCVGNEYPYIDELEEALFELPEGILE